MPFGFILISSLKDIIFSISKRDNSYIKVINYSSIMSEGL